MDAQLLSSRIRDAVRICENNAYPKFVGFLRAEESAEAEAVAKKENCRYVFFGGYDGAERTFFGVFPDWCEDFEEYFPITALTFRFRTEDALSHRDFLGTFMSLGITRESVGDILVEKGRAVVFFSEDILRYVKEQVQKVGGAGVAVTEGYEGALPGMTGFKEFSDTVASERLDCIVASLAGCSRKLAAELIEGKMVFVNSVCTDKTVKTVKNGDKITIRGKGKFIIESLDGRTKKDRLIINAKKYI